jgi:acyl carrier protein
VVITLNDVNGPKTFHRYGRGVAEIGPSRPSCKMRIRTMSTTQLSSQDRVTAVVRRILAERSITRSFAPQDDLREVGLTSLDMVNLVLAVESELGVAIPEAEITPTNFRSVASIDALVSTLRDDQRADLRAAS